MDPTEIASDLKNLRVSVDALSNEVRDLRTSVHGNPELQVAGLSARLKTIEDTQLVLRAALKVVEDERSHTKSWMKGAAWVGGIFLGVIGTGGAFGINRTLELLTQIMAELK